MYNPSMPVAYPGAPYGAQPIVSAVPFNGDINASDFCQQVHEHCTKFVGENKCPSVSVCIVRGDYPAYTAGYGLADETRRIPASPPTCYRIGSLSKVFTAVCFMQLVEQGRIGLHDLVQKHLPYFQPRGSNNGADITCHHLLTHYAGLPHTIPKQGDNVFETLESLVRKSTNMRQLTPAGQVHKYSNAGITVIGHLIERVSGKNFVQYAYDHLFQPLEMHYSTFANWQLPPHIAERMAIGHNDQKIFHQPPIYGTPAGGMVSTVLDIANFITMIINKGQFRGRSILRPETLEMMITVQNEQKWRTEKHPPWGLGFALGKGGFPQQRVVRHNGATQSFMSNLIVLPDKRMGIIAITNCRTEVWNLGPLTIRALQMAAKCAPSAEPEEKEEAADE